MLQAQIDDLTQRVERAFGLSSDSLNVLLENTSEAPVQDIEGDYNFGLAGKLKLKFFDTSALIQGVDSFRPLIRGFTVLMLLFFVFKQVLTLIGQDPGMYSRAHDEASNHSKGDKK